MKCEYIISFYTVLYDVTRTKYPGMYYKVYNTISGNFEVIRVAATWTSPTITPRTTGTAATTRTATGTSSAAARAWPKPPSPPRDDPHVARSRSTAVQRVGFLLCVSLFAFDTDCEYT